MSTTDHNCPEIEYKNLEYEVDYKDENSYPYKGIKCFHLGRYARETPYKERKEAALNRFTYRTFYICEGDEEYKFIDFRFKSVKRENQ